MIKTAILRKAYLFIKKNRLRKKLDIYKLAFSVMVDFTTAIYLLVVGGYLFASVFILGDVVTKFYDQFELIEEFARDRYWLIVTIIPLRYITQSFSRPGVSFSSAEHQLSMLPYDKGKVWFLSVLEKWVKKFTIFMVIGFVIVLITPTPLSLILAYIGLFMLIEVGMTVPQWKLYQTRIIIKVGWLGLLFALNAVNLIIDSPIFSITLVSLLIIVNIRLIQTLFSGVKWSQVIEVSDYYLWNMLLIARVSETKFQRQKKPISQKSTKRKSFKYEEKFISRRMWAIYLRNNAELLIQTIGALVVLLIVLLFIDNFVFYIGLAVVIHVYTTVLASLFSDRFTSDLIQVLPWSLLSYKKAYFSWFVYGGIILIVPISIFLGMNATIWTPFQLLFYVSVTLFLYHMKINKAIALLGNQSISFQLEEGLGFLFLIGIGFSGLHPWITLFFFVVIWLLNSQKENVLSKVHT